MIGETQGCFFKIYCLNNGLFDITGSTERDDAVFRKIGHFKK